MVRNAHLILCVVFVAAPGAAMAQADVRVEPAQLQGPRPLEEQTRTAAIRDYLDAWQSFGAAFDQNRAELLDRDFTGTARDKLGETIQQQSNIGIRTRYQDHSHDLQFVFYSPDGLSIELKDKVEYDVEILDHDKVQATQHLTASYIVVLTPAEARWKVRVFEAQPE
jgi:hypothetical protein